MANSHKKTVIFTPRDNYEYWLSYSKQLMDPSEVIIGAERLMRVIDSSDKSTLILIDKSMRVNSDYINRFTNRVDIRIVDARQKN